MECFGMVTGQLGQCADVRVLVTENTQCSLGRSSASVSVWNLGLAMKTVVDSDSVAVFKSGLKTFLFSPGFLSSLFSVAHCLAPAPLKLRLYGAIQICSDLFFSLLPVLIDLANKDYHY